MLKSDVYDRTGCDEMTRNAFYFVMGCVLAWGFVATYIVSSMTTHWRPGTFEFLLVGLGLPLLGIFGSAVDMFSLVTCR